MRWVTSGRLTPAAATATRTSPALGEGVARSPRTSCSGPPGALISMQRMEAGSGMQYPRRSIAAWSHTMDTDDLDPVKKKPVKKDLTRMSVGDLNDYIVELKAEIARAEA